MQRTSFWHVHEMPQHPVLRGRWKTDVAVVGGGLTGLTCALWLKRAGLSVALVEAERLGSCASSRCAGVVSFANRLFYSRLEDSRGQDTAKCHVQTQQSAVRAIEDILREHRQPWEEVIVRLTGEREGELISETDAMKRAGIRAEMRSQSGQHWIDILQMHVMQPMEYLQLLADDAKRLGVKIYEDSRAVSLETNEVHTQRGCIQAPYIIIATGYPIVNVPGWYFLKIQQRKSMLIPLAGNRTFEGVWLDGDGRFALRPITNGTLMQYNGGYAGSRENDAVMEEDIRRIAHRAGMTARDMRDTALECLTDDGLPFVGPYSTKTPNLFVASGYGGKGIIGSMIAAQAITARILGLPADGYEIYSGQRSLGSLRTPLAIGGRYARELLAHPLAPHCPHMGCRLVYRPQRRIWECPCHGSRFDDIGHVLNAPAVHDAILQNRKAER